MSAYMERERIVAIIDTMIDETKKTVDSFKNNETEAAYTAKLVNQCILLTLQTLKVKIHPT